MSDKPIEAKKHATSKGSKADEPTQEHFLQDQGWFDAGQDTTKERSRRPTIPVAGRSTMKRKSLRNDSSKGRRIRKPIQYKRRSTKPSSRKGSNKNPLEIMDDDDSQQEGKQNNPIQVKDSSPDSDDEGKATNPFEIVDNESEDEGNSENPIYIEEAEEELNKSTTTTTPTDTSKGYVPPFYEACVITLHETVHADKSFVLKEVQNNLVQKVQHETAHVTNKEEREKAMLHKLQSLSEETVELYTHNVIADYHSADVVCNENRPREPFWLQNASRLVGITAMINNQNIKVLEEQNVSNLEKQLEESLPPYLAGYLNRMTYDSFILPILVKNWFTWQSHALSCQYIMAIFKMKVFQHYQKILNDVQGTVGKKDLHQAARNAFKTVMTTPFMQWIKEVRNLLKISLQTALFQAKEKNMESFNLFGNLPIDVNAENETLEFLISDANPVSQRVVKVPSPNRPRGRLWLYVG